MHGRRWIYLLSRLGSQLLHDQGEEIHIQHLKLLSLDIGVGVDVGVGSLQCFYLELPTEPSSRGAMSLY